MVTQPNNLIRIQGIIFSVFAYAVSLMSAFLNSFDEKSSLVILAIFITTLGVPHGSLDTLFARELLNLSQLKKWSKFILNYLMVAAVVVFFWLLLPTIFLLFFLLISVIHFSDDLIAGTPKLSRILYGGIIIFLPALLHTKELTQLYSFLIDVEHSKWLVTSCHFIAFPWLFGLLIAIYQTYHFNKVSSLEISAVSVLAILITPLLAFTIYFCAMHSFRHLIRSMSYLQHSSKKIMLASMLIPTLFVIITGGFVFKIMAPSSIDAGLVRLIFVTLAALTVPHMILLQKSGFSNWIKSD